MGQPLYKSAVRFIPNHKQDIILLIHNRCLKSFDASCIYLKLGLLYLHQVPWGPLRALPGKETAATPMGPRPQDPPEKPMRGQVRPSPAIPRCPQPEPPDTCEQTHTHTLSQPLCMHTGTHVPTGTWRRAHTSTCAHADSQTHTYTVPRSVQTCVHTQVTHTCPPTYTHRHTRTGQTARYTHVHNCTNSLPQECTHTHAHTHPCSSLQEPHGGRNQQGHAGPFHAEPASPRARPLLSAAGSTPTWSRFLGAEGSPPPSQY